ncbi:MAG: hypothetical protein QM498_01085 [Desulfobacterium sp.]
MWVLAGQPVINHHHYFPWPGLVFNGKGLDENGIAGVKNTVIENGNIYFISINEVIQTTPKTLKEAKGIVTADYQTQLEKEWIASLKAKYKVDVNNDVLSTVKQ